MSMEENDRRHAERRNDQIDEQISKIPVIEVKTEMLTASLDKIATKFESSVDKLQIMISSLTASFTQQLYEHTTREDELNRIRDNRAEEHRKESDQISTDRHEELKSEISKYNESLNTRITALEKKQWYQTGAFSTISLIIGVIVAYLYKHLTNS